MLRLSHPVVVLVRNTLPINLTPWKNQYGVADASCLSGITFSLV